ncbi:MAG: hypothetical protein WBP41_13595, partial [Saprospiraceae bacterium]
QTGSGHSTLFYYDDPSSTQLQRLFGQNVGKAKYYKRNLVMDPNGQISVNYTDLAGHTIATALAGKSPDNVLPLKDEASSQILENLMENNVIDQVTGESVLTTYIFNEVVDEDDGPDYYFNYSLEGLNIDQGTSICKSCTYELVIKITDPAGNVCPTCLIEHTFTGEDLCESATYSEALEEIPLDFDLIGLYTIEKILKPVPLSIDEWMVLLHDQLPNVNDFIDTFLAHIDTTECIQSCDQYCRDSILVLYPWLSGESFAQALSDSIDSCVLRVCIDTLLSQGSLSSCDAMHAQMISQFKRGGCLEGTWMHPEDHAIDNLTFIVEEEEVDGENMYSILANRFWEDSWADTLALIHPDTCCYRFCRWLADSREFDYRMPLHGHWADVDDPGEMASFIASDPFFISGGPGEDFDDEMNNALNTYGTNSQGSVQACVDLGVSSPPEPIDLVEMINCVMPAGTPEEKWQFFVGAYLGIKSKLTDDARKATCGAPGVCTVCQSIPQDFVDIDSIQNAIDFINDQKADLCTDVCEGNATIVANLIL